MRYFIKSIEINKIKVYVEMYRDAKRQSSITKYFGMISITTYFYSFCVYLSLYVRGLKTHGCTQNCLYSLKNNILQGVERRKNTSLTA